MIWAGGGVQRSAAWDMTILAYWAAEFFPALDPRRFLYPLGSGTLGYAWPAALGAAVALLVIDDGGYGILRQRHAYGETYAVDLVQPNFAALSGAFGVPAKTSTPQDLAADLAWALELEGTAVVILPTVLEPFEPIA